MSYTIESPPVRDKHTQFLDVYYPDQNWFLPDSVIYYMTMYPSTPKGYQNLMKSCKYFFIKNPILVIKQSLLCAHDRWYASESDSYNGEKFDYTKIASKLWITDKFEVCFDGFLDVDISKFYRCSPKVLSLDEQVLTYKEFLFFSSNVEMIVLMRTVIKNENGSIVPLEKLVESLPKSVKEIGFIDNTEVSSVTKNTVKAILDFFQFSSNVKFTWFEIDETFDIEDFFTSIKKNKQQSKFYLHFFNEISNAYKNLLESIVDEILETQNYDYQPPYICFVGLSAEKNKKLQSIYNNLVL